MCSEKKARWAKLFHMNTYLPHDSQSQGERYHNKGSYEGNGVKDVDEKGEHLSVEVAWEDGAKRSEDHHNGDTDNEESPGIRLHSSVCHHLSPVKPWDCKLFGHEVARQ